MIQQSPTEERAGGLPDNLAEIIEDELRSWRGANGGIYAIPAASRAVAIKLRAAALTQAAQPAEADGVERLRAEIERQCSIDAGTFTVDDGFAQSGLWQINADLDPNGLASALAVTPKAPATDAGEVNIGEAIRKAKVAAVQVYGIAWHHLEEISRVELILAALATPPAPNDDLRAALERIRTSMALLQQNSEGCALNHYGDDANLHGLPGWLADTKADLDKFTTILAALKENRRG